MITPHSKSIILLRGLPGSGKSTLADLLSENGKYPVYSVDDFFTDQQGNYKFDHQKNYLAYESCKQNVITSAMNGMEKIFVDNTFTIDWEMEPYFKIAAEYGYRIFIVTVENYHGSSNIHQIPDEQLKKMAEKYKIKLIP